MKELIKFLKRYIIIINLFVSTFFLTSCTGGRELKTLGIVVATGIDIVDNKIVITNEIINPAMGAASKNATTQENTIFVQGIGNTIEDAIVDTILTFDRTPYFPHSHLIIFGEEFAKKGIGAYIDTLTRSNEQREQAFLLVAKGAKAYDVMGINSGMAQSPGRYLYDIIRQDIFNEETRTITINEFFKYYYRPHEEFILGIVKGVERPQISKNVPENKMDVLSVQGGAAFKDDRLIGYYTGEEMIGFNFLVDEVTNTSIQFESPDYLVDDARLRASKNNLSILRVFRSNTKNDIRVVDGKLHLFIDIVFRGSLREVTQGLDIAQPGVLSEIEKACADKVKTIIAKTLKKAQKEFKADSFSIGELVHRKYPELWKEVKDDWPVIFSDIDYTINVTANINDIGFTSTPPNILKGK